MFTSHRRRGITPLRHPPILPTPQAQSTTYLFLNAEEAAFIEAAVARLIPNDDEWAGALEAGVPNYIDKQLAGAWGAGERLYRSGPWQPGTPSQGYQLPLHAGGAFPHRAQRDQQGAGAADARSRKMSSDQQDAYLKSLEAGGKDLGGVPSDVFFAHLWECTLEGFFSDPVYGGNRDMVLVADDRFSRRLRILLRSRRPARHQDRSAADEPRRGRARACPHESGHPGPVALDANGGTAWHNV